MLASAALRSQRSSNRDDSAESLRRIVAGASWGASISARGDHVRAGDGPHRFISVRPVNARKSATSTLGAACFGIGDVGELGRTSESALNSTEVDDSLPFRGIRSRDGTYFPCSSF